MKKISFDKMLYDSICDAWITASIVSKISEMMDKIPAEEDLSNLTEQIFFSSLKKEEGFYTQARIIFFDDLSPSTFFKKKLNLRYWPFKDAIPLNPQSLRKLALAFDKSKTAFVVTKKKGEYFLNGACLYGSRLSFFNSARQAASIPNFLVIDCHGPGLVNISFGDYIIGRLVDGEFHKSDPGPLSSQIFVEYLLKTIKQHEIYQYYGMDYWFLYRDCLEALYKTMAAFQRGGTIVWLPESAVDAAEKDINSGTKLQLSSSSLLQIWEEYLENSNNRAIRETARRQLCDHIEMLAEMTRVDGALIVNEYFMPLRFGAHLAAEKFEGPIYKGKVLFVDKKEEYRLSGGTRHESAVNFVASHPEAIAFVASEDGPLRTIMNFKGDLFIWPDSVNTTRLE